MVQTCRAALGGPPVPSTVHQAVVAVLIGVVGPEDAIAVQRAVTAIESRNGVVHVGDAPSVVASEPDRIVAVGESALLDLVRSATDVPVLPVEAGPGTRSIRSTDVTDAVARLFDDVRTVGCPRLAVAVSGEPVGTALFDVTFVTTEPGRISEFSVSTGDASVAAFRADGVVVATPAGSQGYARRADGPLVDPALDAAAVTPIAPFSVDHDTWVLALDEPLSVRVERDEVAVSLYVDDRFACEIEQTDRIDVRTDGVMHLIVVPESASVFDERS